MFYFSCVISCATTSEASLAFGLGGFFSVPLVVSTEYLDKVNNNLVLKSEETRERNLSTIKSVIKSKHQSIEKHVAFADR